MTSPLQKFVRTTFVSIQELLPCQFGSYLVMQGTRGACKKLGGPRETLLYFIVWGALLYSTVLNCKTLQFQELATGFKLSSNGSGCAIP